MRVKIAFAALLAILVIINWSVLVKERHLTEGRTVYLQLAPVDPRSIMQGDFMRLRFRLANDIYNALPKTKEHRRWGHNLDATDGLVIVKLSPDNIASFKEIYQQQRLADDELLMRYRVRDGAVKFATDAFFFQEGHEPYYRNARYGQFRVNSDGDLLLAALHGADLNKLGPDPADDQGNAE